MLEETERRRYDDSYPPLVAVVFKDEEGNSAHFSYYPNSHGFDPMPCLSVTLKGGQQFGVDMCENDTPETARLMATTAIEEATQDHYPGGEDQRYYDEIERALN